MNYKDYLDMNVQSFDSQDFDCRNDFELDDDTIQSIRTLAERSGDTEISYALGRIEEQLRRQSEALQAMSSTHEKIENDISQEAVDRATSDRKYFWVGAVTSALIAFAVEYAPELIALVQQLIR